MVTTEAYHPDYVNSPSTTIMLQWTKLASPGVMEECNQYIPLAVSAPSLRLISPQDSAGNSALEPRGTGEKIIKKTLTNYFHWGWLRRTFCSLTSVQLNFVYLFCSTASCKDDPCLLQKPPASLPLCGCSTRKCHLRWNSLYSGTEQKHDTLACTPKDL